MELFRLFGSIFINDNDANRTLDNVDKKAGGVGAKLGSMASMAGTAALSLGALGAAAVGGLAVKGVMAADELQKALNGVQASTGTSTEGMAGMKQAMLDIYNNNFGESFEDIGKSMSTVGQQTGLTGQALKDMTQNALALRDTFEFEVNESLRSAKMLQDQFGVSGEEAYDLITQGAQKGLDKNGDLLDSINEYSVHFKQLGFDSTEMMNMLVNGSASGTFSVDKLGDAIKEFGIRVKDGSKGTVEAFNAIGVNADETGVAFLKGGATGKKAFEEVSKKLLEMKDPMAQNTAGVALFGSMWEDLGVEGIRALIKTEGGIKKNSDALKELNKVKYDTFGEAIAGIGRKINTSIFIPIGEKLLPKMNELAAWIVSNMPKIESFVNGAMSSALNAFDATYKIIQDYLVPAFNSLWAWIQPYMPQIKAFVKDTFESITTIYIPALSKAFDAFVKYVMPTVIDIFNYVVKNVLPPLIDILKYIYTEVVPQLAQKFQEWIPKIMDTFNSLWSALKPLLDWMLKKFEEVWPLIKVAVTFAIDFISQSVGGLITRLGGLIDFISGVFSGDWSKAWNGIKTIFTSIWDEIWGKIEAIKDAFNSLFGVQKKTEFKPTQMKVERTVPMIQESNGAWHPAFAEGGIVTRPTMALVGEGSEAEAILPLSKLDRLMQKGKNGANIVLNITGNTISSDYDVERIMNIATKRLRYEGVY